MLFPFLLYRAHEDRPKNGIRAHISTVHRIACVIPIPETNVETSNSGGAILINMCRGFPRILSRKYRVMREERSMLYEVIVSAIVRRKDRMHLCLIMINYLDRAY